MSAKNKGSDGKPRWNITLDAHLHEWALAEAKRRGTNFSGYVAALIYEAQTSSRLAAQVSSLETTNRAARAGKGR